MTFEIHDEGGFEDAAIFLRDWLPASAAVLERQLGVGTADVIHVVLSDPERHARRFPPRNVDLRALLVDDPGAAAPEQRFPFSTYAHGIATIARPGLDLPEAVELGAPLICLDVAAIDELADQIVVPRPAMLARVATHETSHVLRGHAAGDGRVAHGYIKEGDAQRDTWQTLHDLLEDPAWVTTARAARAAQVLLAQLQPVAYSLFGQSSPDRAGPDAGFIADPVSWTFRPARSLLPLSRRPVIEVPVVIDWQGGAPSVGDHVYLYDMVIGSPDLLAGPWHVIGTSAEATTPHAKDLQALATDDNRPFHTNTGSGRSLRWVRLRAASDLRAGETADPSLQPGNELRAQRLRAGAETRLLQQTLTEPGAGLIERVAARRREDHRLSMEALRRDFTENGVPYDEYAFSGMLNHDPFEE